MFQLFSFQDYLQYCPLVMDADYQTFKDSMKVFNSLYN